MTLRFFAVIIVIFMTKIVNADDGPSVFDIQNGGKLINVSCEPDKAKNSTTIVCRVFGADLQLKETKNVVVEEFAGKICQAYGRYNFYDATKLEYVEILLKEKLFSKSALIVWLSPDYLILKKYTIDYSKFGMMSSPHEKGFIEGKNLSCFPVDHGIDELTSKNFTKDCWSAPGERAYLYYDFECTGMTEGRTLFTKKPAKIDSRLHYFKAGDAGINSVWSLDIEEERILNYQLYSVGNNLILYTSYLKGTIGGKGNEIFESRIRLIDESTGTLVYNCLIPGSVGFEYMHSSLWFDQKTGEIVIAGNYVSVTEQPHNENNDEINSKFVVGKISKTGEPKIVQMEVPWRASDVVINKRSFPLLAVRAMGVESNGNIVIGAMHLYWTMDCSSIPSREGMTAPALSFGNQGLQVLYFSTALELLSAEQFVMPIEGLYDPLIGDVHTCDIRQTLISCYYSDLGKLNRSRWNAETETLIMVQLNWSFEAITKNRDYYALKFSRGKQLKFEKIGTKNFSSAHPGVTDGFILSDTEFCARANENSRKLSVFKM